MSGSPTVAELVVAHQDGDRRALERIVRRVQSPLIRLAHHVLRDPIAAEDGFIEAMARVLPRAMDFENPEAFEAYMRRAVRNAAVDAFRRKSDRDARSALVDTDRMRRRAAEEEDVVVERLPSSVPDPEQAAVLAERRRLLSDAVASLKEPGRTTVRLFYEEELTYEQIASRIGVSAATVKRHLGAARLLLASRMGAGEGVSHAH